MSMYHKKISAVMCALLLTVIARGVLSSQEIDDRPAFRVYLKMDRFAFDGDGAVKLYANVKNSMYKQESFKVYDLDYITFQPVVYNSRGREAEILVPHRLMNIGMAEAIKEREPRIITLARNETITHVIDLKKIYRLEEGEEYTVRLFFVPDPEKDFSIPGENILRFRMTRPPDYHPLVRKEAIREDHRDRTDYRISPRETIILFLTAEKERAWDNHIKYIRVENLINSYPNFGKLYNASDDAEKLKIERDFITFLKRERSDYVVDFSVEKENIVPGKEVSYVDARVKRYGARFHFNYNYRYTLEKFDRVWLITGVEATVKKGY